MLGTGAGAGTLGVEPPAGAEVVPELGGDDVPPAGADVDDVPPLGAVPDGVEVVVGVDLVVVDGVVRERGVVEVPVFVARRGAVPPPKIVVWWLEEMAWPAISSGRVSTAIAATQAAKPVSTASFQRGRRRCSTDTPIRGLVAGAGGRDPGRAAGRDSGRIADCCGGGTLGRARGVGARRSGSAWPSRDRRGRGAMGAADPMAWAATFGARVRCSAGRWSHSLTRATITGVIAVLMRVPGAHRCETATAATTAAIPATIRVAIMLDRSPCTAGSGVVTCSSLGAPAR